MNTAMNTVVNYSGKTWPRGGSRNHEMNRAREIRNAEIFKLRNEGISTHEIASRFGISEGYVGIIYNKEKRIVENSAQLVQTKRSYASISERNASIVDMRKSGMKTADIAIAVGVSESHIKKILNKYDVRRPIKKIENFKTEAAMRKDERNAKMMELRMQGFSNEEIAEQMRVCKTTVLRAISYQPTEMTLANQECGRQIRKLKEQFRKDVAESLKNSTKNHDNTVVQIPSVTEEFLDTLLDKLLTRIAEGIRSSIGK